MISPSVFTITLLLPPNLSFALITNFLSPTPPHLSPYCLPSVFPKNLPADQPTDQQDEQRRNGGECETSKGSSLFNTDTRQEEMDGNKQHRLMYNDSQSVVLLSLLLLLLDWLHSGGDREGSARYCRLYRRHSLCLWEMGGCHSG